MRFLGPWTPNFVHSNKHTNFEIDHDNIRVAISMKRLLFERFNEYVEQICLNTISLESLLKTAD